VTERIPEAPRRRRQWRDYRTASGARPVKTYLDKLTDEEVAAVIAGMKEVARDGLPAGKHLHGDVYEIRADAPTRSFRLLFSAEGRFKQVLLSLSVFSKKTQKTPPRELAVAESRYETGAVEAPSRAAVARSGEKSRVHPRGAPFLSSHILDAMARAIQYCAWPETFSQKSSTREPPEIPSFPASLRKRKSGANLPDDWRRSGRRKRSRRPLSRREWARRRQSSVSSKRAAT